jgi:hypothetical protein
MRTPEERDKPFSKPFQPLAPEVQRRMTGGGSEPPKKTGS